MNWIFVIDIFHQYAFPLAILIFLPRPHNPALSRIHLHPHSAPFREFTTILIPHRSHAASLSPLPLSSFLPSTTLPPTLSISPSSSHTSFRIDHHLHLPLQTLSLPLRRPIPLLPLLLLLIILLLLLLLLVLLLLFVLPVVGADIMSCFSTTKRTAGNSGRRSSLSATLRIMPRRKQRCCTHPPNPPSK